MPVVVEWTVTDPSQLGKDRIRITPAVDLLNWMLDFRYS
jgi:hypothetical protein